MAWRLKRMFALKVAQKSLARTLAGRRIRRNMLPADAYRKTPVQQAASEKIYEENQFHLIQRARNKSA